MVSARVLDQAQLLCVSLVLFCAGSHIIVATRMRLIFVYVPILPPSPGWNSSDLEWKVIYVGSAEDMHADQVLDEILVGPVPVGVNKFVLQADAPDPASIPSADILGVTVVLVTCSYKAREFIRIGYYVNDEHADPYDPEVGPPSPLDIT